MDVAGAYAMFDGVGSPLTQSFGLGLFADARGEDLARMEAFFEGRGAEVFHEVSPMADPALLELLVARGYRPVELTSVLFRPTAGVAGAAPGVTVRRTGVDEADLWARTAADGWSTESPGLSDFMFQLGRVIARAEGTFCFLAELDGAPAAAGALSIGDGVALLAGASTVPGARRRGAQRALLEARIKWHLRRAGA
jgi:hypothetical protein